MRVTFICQILLFLLNCREDKKSIRFDGIYTCKSFSEDIGEMFYNLKFNPDSTVFAASSIKKLDEIPKYFEIPRVPVGMGMFQSVNENKRLQT